MQPKQKYTMSDTVTVALIISSGPIVLAIVAAFIKKWVTNVKKEVAAVSTKLDEVHKQINGHMTELLDTTKKLENAIGNREGRAELKEEQKKDG